MLLHIGSGSPSISISPSASHRFTSPNCPSPSFSTKCSLSLGNSITGSWSAAAHNRSRFGGEYSASFTPCEREMNIKRELHTILMMAFFCTRVSVVACLSNPSFGLLHKTDLLHIIIKFVVLARKWIKSFNLWNWGYQTRKFNYIGKAIVCGVPVHWGYWWHHSWRKAGCSWLGRWLSLVGCGVECWFHSLGGSSWVWATFHIVPAESSVTRGSEVGRWGSPRRNLSNRLYLNKTRRPSGLLNCYTKKQKNKIVFFLRTLLLQH